MNKFFKISIGIGLLFGILTTSPTYSWNARGHMIVAAIAYRELTPEQQQTITGILVSHPEYKRQWAADYREIQEDVNLGLYLFMRASRWPDDIRSNKHSDHGLNTPKWHYMNYELRFPYKGELVVSEQENVLDAIEQNLRIFRNPDSPLDRKAISLCWLIHLVGDIHQPLHTVSLFSDQFPKGDRGGNSFWIKPKGAVKLHSYWDGLLGRSMSVQSILNEVTLIKSNYKKDSNANKLDPIIWSQESFNLAVEKVYLNGELKASAHKENALPVPENYGKESKQVGEQQVALAGHRLAKIL